MLHISREEAQAVLRQATGNAAEAGKMLQSMAGQKKMGPASRTSSTGETSSLLGCTFPNEWLPMAEDGGATRAYAWWRHWEYCDVALESEAGQRVSALFASSMGAAKVARVQRIQHRLLWRRYCTRRDEVALKNDGDPNELLLWHGTSATSPGVILRSESGLDDRLASSGFYGKSAALAQLATTPKRDKLRARSPRSTERERLHCVAAQASGG